MLARMGRFVSSFEIPSYTSLKRVWCENIVKILLRGRLFAQNYLFRFVEFSVFGRDVECDWSVISTEANQILTIILKIRYFDKTYDYCCKVTQKS